MSTAILVKDVLFPTYLSTFVFSDVTVRSPEEDPIPSKLVRMEVYAGWIGCNFGGGSTTAKREIVSFVPINKSTVRQYEQVNDVVDFTVSAGLSSVFLEEDESTLFSVDDATVALEEQIFPGIAGKPPCLVLRADLAMLNGNLGRIMYQVTVLSVIHDRKIMRLALDPSTAPAA